MSNLNSDHRRDIAGEMTQQVEAFIETLRAQHAKNLEFFGGDFDETLKEVLWEIYGDIEEPPPVGERG